jgi:hypothetical protein
MLICVIEYEYDNVANWKTENQCREMHFRYNILNFD